ncbi:MAG: tRNA (adenosine(37)-N6)-dimethylallyltransferase MiaA [Candidatus Hydrogenedentes bacterium]|nr:tRNA (adenosine(37)-N6)-dimethylallyltransferase MiaA [Candidatus Hydrogenedentota bacterium]
MTALVAVVGPTASGKTALALALANRLDTEIISADSMQVYRGMEIGTSAPTAEEQAQVRHHFIGVRDPGEIFSAGEFERSSRAVVKELNARGKIAVVVGGSGLYVSALIDGLFDGPGKDGVIRERLQHEAETAGVGKLYARLEAVDPDYSAIISPTDLRRITRALEVHELTGQPISRLHRDHREQTESLDAVQVALDYPRDVLYARINARVDDMIRRGFVAEVERLLAAGHERHLMQIKSLGYREIISYLHGTQSLEEAVALMKRNTRRYAKRQLTWFRGDPRIRSVKVEPGVDLDSIAEDILATL